MSCRDLDILLTTFGLANLLNNFCSVAEIRQEFVRFRYLKIGGTKPKFPIWASK